jgi:hypothetical protein
MKSGRRNLIINPNAPRRIDMGAQRIAEIIQRAKESGEPMGAEVAELLQKMTAGRENEFASKVVSVQRRAAVQRMAAGISRLMSAMLDFPEDGIEASLRCAVMGATSERIAMTREAFNEKADEMWAEGEALSKQRKQQLAQKVAEHQAPSPTPPADVPPHLCDETDGTGESGPCTKRYPHEGRHSWEADGESTADQI